MTLTNDELFQAEGVEIRFGADADADRAASRPEIGPLLRAGLAGRVARIRPWHVHELRSHLQALGIAHEEGQAGAPA